MERELVDRLATAVFIDKNFERAYGLLGMTAEDVIAYYQDHEDPKHSGRSFDSLTLRERAKKMLTESKRKHRDFGIIFELMGCEQCGVYEYYKPFIKTS